jgi:hypothetical protein
MARCSPHAEPIPKALVSTLVDHLRVNRRPHGEARPLPGTATLTT